jgi:uncharacterized protein (TIGR03437 family)
MYTKWVAPSAVIALTGAVAWGQVCRVQVSGINRDRRVMGAVHAECPPTVHTVPFGNWGVTSNFGQKLDGHQFQGWCHNTRVCDNQGNCRDECRDGWYEWNSCTDITQWAPPNCTLYNDANCTQQATTTGTNVHGSHSVDLRVNCPSDTNGDAVADQGGCADIQTYSSGTNFMSLYEMDPGTTDDLIQTVYYPESVLNMTCDVWGCSPVSSPWLQPSFYDSPSFPAKVFAEMAVVLGAATFVDTSRACRTVSANLSVVSGATFLTPAAAPESIAAIFGQGLATSSESAAVSPLPTWLNGTEVSITDARGISRMAPLFYVSPNQVNIYVPPGTAVGPAQIRVMRSDSLNFTGNSVITTVAPGLFTANADASGVAAATAIRVNADGFVSSVPVFQCGAAVGSCLPVDIDLGSGSERVFISLYGTGLRGYRAAGAVTVDIGGSPIEPLYVGPQNEYLGLDQVNFELPQTLRGRGQVEVILEIAGSRSNSVLLSIH